MSTIMSTTPVVLATGWIVEPIGRKINVRAIITVNSLVVWKSTEGRLYDSVLSIDPEWERHCEEHALEALRLALAGIH